MSSHYTDNEGKETLIHELYEYIKDKKEIVIVCVGSDRATGDSLGPLVGERLKNEILKNTYIYGNLEYPVHAKNLDEVRKKINKEHKNAFIIAIDAALGRLKSVGKVTLNEGPLKPGSGVNKDLTPIGDIHITGIVNVGGYMEMLVLQNTRLFEVVQLSDYISHVVIQSIALKNRHHLKRQMLFK